MLDLIRLNAVVNQVIGDMPHPQAPELKVRDYRASVHAAAMIKGGDGARPADVVETYHLLKQLEMSPAEFEHAWTLAYPIANRLLGRDPSAQEIKQLNGLHPADIHDYYASSPYPGYEEVKAIDMARYFHAATPIAHATLGRDPLPLEVARFASAGYDEESMHRHYTHQGKSQNG